MGELLVAGVEIAVLLLAALPFARVWLEPGFRRKLVVFPASAVQIVAGTALAAGGTVLFCLVVPSGLTLAALAAVPAIGWERWRARSGHGRAKGLPPGSLALAPSGPWRDERFYERQAARHGPRRVPRGFLRYMDVESHRRYRPVLTSAVSQEVLHAAEPFVKARICATLEELEQHPTAPRRRRSGICPGRSSSD